MHNINKTFEITAKYDINLFINVKIVYVAIEIKSIQNGTTMKWMIEPAKPSCNKSRLSAIRFASRTITQVKSEITHISLSISLEKN